MKQKMWPQCIFKRGIFVVVAVGALLALQGCASPASSSAMEVSSAESQSFKNEKINNTLTVRNITGGKDTNPLWTSQVDSSSLKTALTQSLQNAGLAASSPDKSKYFVDAHLQALTQPAFGFTFDVKSIVRYTVEGEGTRKIYPVTATGTATTSDAFVGVERLKIANERSIKENIKQFLHEISFTLGK